MSFESVTAALSQLRDILLSLKFPQNMAGNDKSSQDAARIVAQLSDYILPRLENHQAPLLAVVGGSTGAGKSTLVNTLIGRVVSAPGVIRPTTKSPVLIYHPDDEYWFEDDRILPGLSRSKISNSDIGSLRLVPEPTLPQGLAIIDAPDIDSVDEANRKLAATLLAAGDLWIFLTSAIRYADAVPWQFLQSAAGRGAAVAVVIDRIPPTALRMLPQDLAKMMTKSGLAQSPLFAIPETVTDHQGLLPDGIVSPIRSYLATLAANKAKRFEVIMRTLGGAIGSVNSGAVMIADQLETKFSDIEQSRSLKAGIDRVKAALASEPQIHIPKRAILTNENSDLSDDESIVSENDLAATQSDISKQVADER